jgi:hypothetical protein
VPTQYQAFTTPIREIWDMQETPATSQLTERADLRCSGKSRFRAGYDFLLCAKVQAKLAVLGDWWTRLSGRQ